MPLYTALAQSFNTAAIRMSVKIGEVYWPPKQSYHLAKIAALGRSKIVETARAMGVTTPLADTVSLPVGADEVKMIDMVGANATLANGGNRATPYAAIEVRNSNGKLIYSHDGQRRAAGAGASGRQGRRDEQHHDPCRDRRHRPRRADSRPRRSPARRARPTTRPTPGSTPSPAISSAASGSATTTTRRWRT